MDLLICEVRKREFLWNRRHPKNRDKAEMDRQWGLVAQYTGLTKEDAKKKWRNLRDHFAKELRRVRRHNIDDPTRHYQGKWRHFDSLIFLTDTLPFKDDIYTTSDADIKMVAADGTLDDDEFKNDTLMRLKHEDMDIVDNVLETSSAEWDSYNRPVSKERQVSFDPDYRQHRKLEITEDDDLMFLKSLIPYFKLMDPIQKLHVRNKIHNIIICEISNIPNSYGPSRTTQAFQNSNVTNVLSSSSVATQTHDDIITSAAPSSSTYTD